MSRRSSTPVGLCTSSSIVYVAVDIKRESPHDNRSPVSSCRVSRPLWAAIFYEEANRGNSSSSSSFLQIVLYLSGKLTVEINRLCTNEWRAEKVALLSSCGSFFLLPPGSPKLRGRDFVGWRADEIITWPHKGVVIMNYIIRKFSFCARTTQFRDSLCSITLFRKNGGQLGGGGERGGTERKTFRELPTNRVLWRT